MGFNIAIDGPAGAGKSTIAKLAASELSYIYVDTGAMYRAIGLYVYRKHVPEEDKKAIGETAKETEVSIRYIDGERHVYLNGEDVSEEIRKEHIGHMASVVGAVPAVREHLLSLQRQIAQENDIIMDGRDIGTNVLPDASLKIYLTASADVRAKRRYDELKEKGADCDIEQIKTDIIARDKQDMEREIAPLCQAEDAILVDSSDMSIPQVIDTIISEFKKIK